MVDPYLSRNIQLRPPSIAPLPTLIDIFHSGSTVTFILQREYTKHSEIFSRVCIPGCVLHMSAFKANFFLCITGSWSLQGSSVSPLWLGFHQRHRFWSTVACPATSFQPRLRQYSRNGWSCGGLCSFFRLLADGVGENKNAETRRRTEPQRLQFHHSEV